MLMLYFQVAKYLPPTFLTLAIDKIIDIIVVPTVTSNTMIISQIPPTTTPSTTTNQTDFTAQIFNFFGQINGLSGKIEIFRDCRKNIHVISIVSIIIPIAALFKTLKKVFRIKKVVISYNYVFGIFGHVQVFDIGVSSFFSGSCIDNNIF